MKAKVLKSEMRAALALVKHALPEKPLIEVDGHVRMEMRPGRIVLRTTDGMLAARAYVSATCDSDSVHEFPVDPKRIEKALSKSETSEDITLEWLEEESAIRVYSRDTGKAFVTFPTLSIRKMAKFPDILSYEPAETVLVEGDLVSESMEFVEAYLPAPREDGRAFDLAVINKGVVYGCNGINKRGYLVAKEFKGVTDLELHKKQVPKLAKMFRSKSGVSFSMSHDESRVVFRSECGNFEVVVLKSRKKAGDVNTSYIRADGPYCEVAKASLVRSLDRSTIASYEKVGHPIGIYLKLIGSEGAASIETQLVTDSKLDTLDSISCARHKDTDAEINHVIDYRLFKDIVNSMGPNDKLRLYINDQDLKFFRIFSSEACGSTTCAKIGVGAYSRVSR